MARQSSKAENSNQPRTHRLAPDGEVAEDYFTAGRSRVPNSLADSKNGCSDPLCSVSSVVESGRFFRCARSLPWFKSLPVAARLRSLLAIGPVALFVSQDGDSHRHKHRRHNQHQNPCTKPLNKSMSRSRSLRIAKRTTLCVAGRIRRQYKGRGQRDPESPHAYEIRHATPQCQSSYFGNALKWISR